MADIAQEFTPNWEQYANQAQTYLNRPVFKGTPITGQLLANSAKQTYMSTGQYIPVELALAQAQKETSMGLKGRNPTTNPYNVYEFDSGTKHRFNALPEGISAYFNLLATDYMPNKGMEGLMKQFTNKKGARYASDPQYESYLQAQIPYIQKFFKRGK